MQPKKNKILLITLITITILLATMADAAQEKTSKKCTCKKMIIKLTGKADDELALPSESFGAPEPTEKETLTPNLGPSIGYVKKGEHKTDLRIGWNFEVRAELEGNSDFCEENQYTRGTTEYAGPNGKIQRVKSHDAGNGVANIISPRGNAGYNSRVWAPDYVKQTTAYCKAIKGDCKQVKTREKKEHAMQWLDSPGAWLPNDYTYYDNKMSVKTIVTGTRDNQCSCVIDFQSTARKNSEREIATTNAIYVQGEKCQIQSTPQLTGFNKKTLTKQVIIK